LGAALALGLILWIGLAAVGIDTYTVQGLPPGAVVDIDHGPHDLGNGDSFDVADGANFRWRLEATGFNGPWNSYGSTGGGTLQVTPADYCDMAIAGLPAGAQVDIDHGPHDLVNGNTVLLPQGINIREQRGAGDVSSLS
jgi:hypothetical protein